MSDMDERIERAAKAWNRERGGFFTSEEVARCIIKAAFPELLDGTAWVAPKEPTRMMLGHMSGLTDFLLPEAIGNTIDDHLREMRLAYILARDAHLKGQETDSKVEG